MLKALNLAPFGTDPFSCSRGISFGATGILISLIAPVIQQRRLSIHPLYFT